MTSCTVMVAKPVPVPVIGSKLPQFPLNERVMLFEPSAVQAVVLPSVKSTVVASSRPKLTRAVFTAALSAFHAMGAVVPVAN